MEISRPTPNEAIMLLRAGEVARLLGVSRAKAYLMLASGELPTVRIGASVRCPASKLREWISQRTEGGF